MVPLSELLAGFKESSALYSIEQMSTITASIALMVQIHACLYHYVC